MNSPYDEKNEAELLGHEPLAVSTNAVVKAVVVLFAVVFATLLLIGGVTMVLTKVDGGAGTVDAPEVRAELPSGVPSLNANQKGSLRELRARERKILTEYAWADQDRSFARIPIKRAMEILSQQTAPAPAAGALP